MIEWKSVYDELPKDGVHVLAIIKNSDKVYTLKFDPTIGWDNGFDCVMFWSYYNLPK